MTLDGYRALDEPLRKRWLRAHMKAGGGVEVGSFRTWHMMKDTGEIWGYARCHPDEHAGDQWDSFDEWYKYKVDKGGVSRIYPIPDPPCPTAGTPRVY